jgi:nickel-dependent lactate racemase
VAIVFDDMSRPTDVAQLVPYVLEELKAGGVKEEGIRFIAALGAHGALTAADFRKKLGEEVVARFPVYNHNPYENCSYVGTTSRGTPVSLNSDFVSCDLKIGIGSVVPHVLIGFGGGGKIVLPGISAMDTIEANHSYSRTRSLTASEEDDIGMGKFDHNPLRFDVEEATRLSGLDIKIDAIVNLKRETVALFVGEPIAEHRESVKFAREHYATRYEGKADIVIANAYSKINEAFISIAVGAPLLREDGGVLVVVSNNPWGEVPHYLLRSFGKGIGGRLWRPPSLPANVKRLFLFMPQMDRTSADWMAPAGSITWLRTWEETVAELEREYPGHPRVAVIPDATIQYFP